MSSHSEGGVEQQHSVASPSFEVAVVGRFDPEILLQLCENVDKRRGYLHAMTHRKAEPVGLARTVVGILAED